MKAKIVTIIGPTASGKTNLAMDLAQKFYGQIICADSRTIYRNMDIGTAKPDKLQQKLIQHYLLDVVDPNEQFSAKDFTVAAKSAIAQIDRLGKTPFIVGGSGMYIDALLFDYKFRRPRQYPDDEIDDKTLAELVRIAEQKYPQYIANIDTKNRRRVEQLITKGPSKDEDRRELKMNSLIIGLSIEKQLLKERIEQRTNNMLNKGFIQEVEFISQRFGKDSIALQTTGYREVVRYLAGEVSFDELPLLISKATFDLAKKQITWFRRNKYITWVETPAQAQQLVKKYLE